MNANSLFSTPVALVRVKGETLTDLDETTRKAYDGKLGRVLSGVGHKDGWSRFFLVEFLQPVRISYGGNPVVMGKDLFDREQFEILRYFVPEPA